jgi:hypothetical protein
MARSSESEWTGEDPLFGEHANRIDDLRKFTLRQLIQGVPRGLIEDDLVRQGCSIEYAVGLVDSVSRTASQREIRETMEGGSESASELAFDQGVDNSEQARQPIAESDQQSDRGFDVHPVPTPKQPPTRRYRRSRWTTLDRALVSVLVVGLGITAAGVAYSLDFWVLWVGGSRATATVTGTSGRVGWGYTRRSVAAGEAWPLIESGFNYRFQDARGQEYKGIVWVGGSSAEWKTGEQLRVMYWSSRPGDSRPSSVVDTMKHDTVCLLASLSIPLGIGLTAVGAGGLGRFRRQSLLGRHAWEGSR